MFIDLVLFDNKSNFFSDINYIKVDFNSKGKDNLIIKEGNTINRDILEKKGLDILVSPEKDIKKDSLHFKRSGLNQVNCEIAKKNNVAIAFSFNDVLSSKDRSLLIGRMMQNVKLCRKFKVKMLIASFAHNEYGLRSYDSLKTFGLVIGMNPGEAKKALEESQNIIKRKN